MKCPENAGAISLFHTQVLISQSLFKYVYSCLDPEVEGRQDPDIWRSYLASISSHSHSFSDRKGWTCLFHLSFLIRIWFPKYPSSRLNGTFLDQSLGHDDCVKYALREGDTEAVLRMPQAYWATWFLWAANQSTILGELNSRSLFSAIPEAGSSKSGWQHGSLDFWLQTTVSHGILTLWEEWASSLGSL